MCPKCKCIFIQERDGYNSCFNCGNIVAKHWDYIQARRALKESWRVITEYLMSAESRELTENTIRAHYRRLAA
jgi:hypothetical protein